MLHPRSHSRVGFLVAVLDRDADTVSGFDDQGVRVWIEDGVDRRNGPGRPGFKQRFEATGEQKK